MRKYTVFAIATASKRIGEFEADCKEDAIKMAEDDAYIGSLCHQCAGKIDLGDIYEFQAEES